MRLKRKFERFVPIKGFQLVVGVQIGIGSADTPRSSIGPISFCRFLESALDAFLLFGYKSLGVNLFVDLFVSILPLIRFGISYDLTNQRPIRTMGLGWLVSKFQNLGSTDTPRPFIVRRPSLENAEHQRDSPFASTFTVKTTETDVFIGFGDFWLTFFASPWRRPPISDPCDKTGKHR